MSRHYLGLAAAAFAVTSLASAATADKNMLTDRTCSVPAGWPQVSAQGPQYVIFGEVHGTRESPAFVGRLACSLAARGERILVGVELPASDNRTLQRAWPLPESKFAAALTGLSWKGRTDGVGSEAMFQLLLRLHDLHSRGRNIDVVAFNGFTGDAQKQRFRDLPGQGPHEAAQAENIRRAADGQHYDHVLVLVGNIHARKTLVEDGAIHFKSMAMQLAPPSEVTTLNMRLSEGSMWNCLVKPGAKLEHGKPIPPGAIDCGNHKGRDAAVDLGINRFIRLGDFPGERPDPSYDGFYWLGRVSGSPPTASRF